MNSGGWEWFDGNKNSRFNLEKGIMEDQQEEDDLALATAYSQDQVEQEEHKTLAELIQQEEEEQVELAIAISQLMFDEQRSSSTADDFQNLYEHFLENHQSRSNESEETLPEMYRNYRKVRTFFSENQMWPLSAIHEQQQELSLSLGGKDEVRVWQEDQSESERCLICLTNVGTRFAVPCGHRLCCRTCMPDLVNKSNFYSVTTPNGQVELTDRRLPLQCFTCRAIIGQIFIPIIT